MVIEQIRADSADKDRSVGRDTDGIDADGEARPLQNRACAMMSDSCSAFSDGQAAQDKEGTVLPKQEGEKSGRERQIDKRCQDGKAMLKASRM